MNSNAYEEVTRRLNELTAMTGAATLALCAATSLLTKEQHQELLRRIARDSAEKQAFVEQTTGPAAPQLVRAMQAAEQAMFQTLQESWAAHNPQKYS